MESPTPTQSAIAQLSREFAFTCRREGTVQWADERASEALHVAAGVEMSTLVAPGSESKLARLLATRDAAGETTELVMRNGGAPVTVAMRAVPYQDCVLVVGSLVSQDYAQLAGRMSETMTELSSMHRESQRQQREISAQRDELASLNERLTESGRGMSALFHELEEKNDSLRVAGEVKTRFVTNMSHELRTPLASIVGLTKLLQSRIDGDLSPEQEKQVSLIRKSADELLDLVSDLLDLSKAEAGRLKLRAQPFSVESLFSTLRGMLAPLATNPDVQLIFGDGRGFPELNTDENKLQQVLRNFISNALKFTERGEVRVEAVANSDDTITFSVTDTGVGIATADHVKLFEEFSQIDNPLQARVKGSGLGLSVTKKLAEFLEGRVDVVSEAGKGSTFSITIPRMHSEVSATAELEQRAQDLDPSRAPVLVVEDDTRALFLYERYLAGSGYQVIPARSIDQARQILEGVKPAAIVLDVMLEGETSWRFLQDVKENPDTCDIPTLVVTVMDRERQARALGADEFFVKPLDKDWLLRKLKGLAAHGPMEKVLVIDDDEVSRYLMRRLLADTRYKLLEAVDGPQGVEMAREHHPDVIVLDFIMPSMTAFDVLDELKIDPTTRNIPIIISTSKQLDDEERDRLARETAAILPKDKLSREVAITRIREALGKTLAVQAAGSGA